MRSELRNKKDIIHFLKERLKEGWIPGMGRYVCNGRNCVIGELLTKEELDEVINTRGLWGNVLRIKKFVDFKGVSDLWLLDLQFANDNGYAFLIRFLYCNPSRRHTNEK